MENDITFGEDEALVSKSRNRKQPDPNDPLWTDMWYLDARASYDVNDRDDDPMPRYEYSDENRHGTRCAGEVAAIFNNSLCIVGIAYNARIGGIRMLDGDVTDAVEAASLGHNSDYVDIYSASWGPDDDGRTVDGPAKLTRAAFERGIREGRRGKGSVFVWASGNGGKDADSCNCDGYTNRYGGHCHIVIRAAKPINLRAGDWVTNGVGRNVSHSFGYGLMDAGAMVQLARNWTTAPEQHKCRQFYPSRFKTIPHGNRLQLQLYTDGCAGSPDEQVVYLEHVQAIITLKAPKRGDIQIYLTSPSGTRSTLLTKRARDTSRAGFIEWAFMTTHSWGELAAGLWTLEVDNDGWDGEILPVSLSILPSNSVFL
ncbi:convertase P-domain protein [Ancylostoma caninum]|uniref:Convertase P-domain protein n=1 Tax=Ancylostoma caninum TaxID=29170 RepID=A0A368FDM7_ANCCA|nr:convertase P-domain protein [Ancylostoma caninum]